MTPDPRFCRHSTLFCASPEAAQEMFSATVRSMVDHCIETTRQYTGYTPALQVLFEDGPIVIGDAMTGYRVEGVVGIVERTEIN